jgi:DNA-binding PadR family transcriptional regulator
MVLFAMAARKKSRREKVLDFLASGEKPTIEIVDAVAGRGLWGLLTGGSVYMLLHDMKDEGLLDSRFEPSVPGEARFPLPRAFYRLKEVSR